MKPVLSKWTLAAYLAAIFAAGAVSGWVVAAKVAKERMFAPPRLDDMAVSLRDRLNATLSLTPAQTTQIDTVVDQSFQEIQSLHENHVKHIREIVSNRNVQITGILTPDQQRLFEEMERERRESSHGRDAWRGKEPRRSKHGDRGRPRGPREPDPDNQPVTNQPALDHPTADDS